MSDRAGGAVCWADVTVHDTPKAGAFYSSLMGWDVEVQPAEYGGYAIATIGGAGDANTVAGVMGPMPGAGADQQPPAAWTPYLETADIDATCAKVVELGGKVNSGPHDVLGRGGFAMIEDPSGCGVGLWEPRGFDGFGHYGENGALAWAEAMTWDPEGTRDFLSALLGLEASKMEDPNAEMQLTYYMLKRPGDQDNSFGVLGLGPDVPEDYPAQWKVYLATSGTDDARRRVIDLGGEAQGPAFDTPFGRIAFVADPDGAAFGLVDMAASIGERPSAA